MTQIPGTDGQFLAIHKFYSPDDSKEAKIVIATPDGNGKWDIQTLVDIPFVHRFDVLKSHGKNYLIACTIKSGHAYKDDWSSPGKVYAARLPDDLSVYNDEHQLELQVIKEGMLKNHGYYKVQDEDSESSLVCSESGVYRFYPPQRQDEEWKIEQLLNTPASDATLIDLDQDGEKELVVLSPFHGSDIRIYKKSQMGYQLVYKYPEKAEFLHAIWSGTIKGKPTAIIGHRMGARRLMAFTWDIERQDYMFKTLDDNCGPANAYGYSVAGKDVLIATNREIDEIAMYIF